MKFFAIFQSFREGGFIRSFFLTARRTNQEGPPFLLTPPSLRTPPLYFAVQNTEEEGESTLPLIADSIISFYCFCFNPLALRALPLYSLTETQGERVNSITFIAGIFNPFPRRYTPQLSPIFSCATPRNAAGQGEKVEC